MRRAEPAARMTTAIFSLSDTDPTLIDFSICCGVILFAMRSRERPLAKVGKTAVSGRDFVARKRISTSKAGREASSAQYPSSLTSFLCPMTKEIPMSIGQPRRSISPAASLNPFGTTSSRCKGGKGLSTKTISACASMASRTAFSTCAELCSHKSW